MNLLHITPHLGGGVGKAISSLLPPLNRDGAIRSSLVCLEPPEKTLFIAPLEAAGIPVHIAPTSATLAEMMAHSDVVQIEFWNHPELISTLASLPPLQARLVIWAHISGLHFPSIPPAIFEAATQVVFTSPCSFQAENLRTTLGESLHQRATAISSAYCPLPEPSQRTHSGPLRLLYAGTQSYSKMHPDYLGFLADCTLPFTLHLVGDRTNEATLRAEAARLGLGEHLVFDGFSHDIQSVFAASDVLLYLLNPYHYGTAENVLIEAMASGVIPIVLPNPAEVAIVTDGVDGLYVDSPAALDAALRALQASPTLRRRLSDQARAKVASDNALHTACTQFRSVYAAAGQTGKRTIDFRAVFGPGPADWFLAFCDHVGDIVRQHDAPAARRAGLRHILSLEATKGSLRHFAAKFPEDSALAALKAATEAYLNTEMLATTHHNHRHVIAVGHNDNRSSATS